jgi:ribose transport system permease protein
VANQNVLDSEFQARLKRLVTNVYFLLLLVILGMLLVAEIVSPGFVEMNHMGAILRTASFLGLAALGQTYVILIGGIDLSIGSAITMGNVISVLLINGSNEATVWAIPLVLGFGALLGLFNGFMIAFAGIHPLVMTLASGSLLQGITLIVSQGAPKGLASPVMMAVSTKQILGVPIVVLIWFGVSILAMFVLRKTAFGRKIYYVGANYVAATYSGIRSRSVQMRPYILSGVTATLTGIMIAGYTQNAYLDVGNPYTLRTVAAVVIGGTSLVGGKGSYLGTFLGAIILVLLNSVLTVIQMPEAGRQMANGLIILIMIGIYYGRARDRGIIGTV